MKFRKHISGMKDKATGKGYVSGYDARIPKEALEDAGFLGKDGSLEEYEPAVMYGDDNETMIVLKKKEADA